ncbi:MAG TPA: serine hydrolase [Pseudolabrys sp.]
MSLGLRWGAAGVVLLVAVTAFTSDADARGRRHGHRARAASSAPYQPPPASIVVDVNSGKVMEASDADSPRHPASLTKIMTLYLLFEKLEQGKIKMTTDLPVSSHAASMAPSKLDLKPGDSIKVESAIRAIVTKSANDIAVTVAEAVGGDEGSFAKMMTAKARALGMKSTNYHNASGLPDEQQITTARDQALLARAIFERFPTYYRYFSTRSFDFRGKSMRNHNHLLGQIEGLDGIKTGYVNASGFNIVTSAARAGKRVIAVVFGGRTARARDAKVTSLIENNINIASAKRTAPPVVEGVEVAEAAPAPEEKKQTGLALRTAAAEPVAPPATAAVAPAAAAPAPPTLGSTDPIKPVAVKTVTVHAGSMRTASVVPAENRKLTPAPANTATVTNITTVKGESQPLPPPPGAKPGILGTLPAKFASATPDAVPLPAPAAESAKSEPNKSASRANGGWMIQVGAFPDEGEAKQRLSAAQSKAKDQLRKADPFTERAEKNKKPIFRARFAGLEKDQAENACKNLKRSEIPCMVMKN